MTLRFEAEVVRCAEAIGGEILQVTFDSVDMEDEDGRQSPYMLLGQCFECPGPPTIEWHDGTDYDGGADIRSIVLKPNSVEITTDTGPDFDVSFSLTSTRYEELSNLLRRMFSEAKVLDTA